MKVFAVPVVLIVIISFVAGLNGVEDGTPHSRQLSTGFVAHRLAQLLEKMERFKIDQPEQSLKFGKEALNLIETEKRKAQQLNPTPEKSVQPGISQSHILLRILKLMAESYKQLGDYKQAFNFYQQYIDLDKIPTPDTGTDDLEREKKKHDAHVSMMKHKIKLLKTQSQRQGKEFQKILILMGIILTGLVSIMIYFRIRIDRKLRRKYHGVQQMDREQQTISKLESIERLAGGLAHDYNNLLSIIVGNLSLALDGMEKYPHITKLIKSAERSAQQAAELSKTLITFSSGGWISPEKIHLNHFLEQLQADEPLFQTIHVEKQIAEDLKCIHVDRNLFSTVICNILQNALDAGSEKEGRPFASIHAVNTELPEGNRFLVNKGEYIKICINDVGKGIDPAHLHKIFDPYFTTKAMSAPRGNGLGLSVCYAVIRKHKGHIRITSVSGKGSCVEIYLPAYK